MEKRLVSMSHGMPIFYPDGPEDDARRNSFPHADEPYRTGYCCPTGGVLSTSSLHNVADPFAVPATVPDIP